MLRATEKSGASCQSNTVPMSDRSTFPMMDRRVARAFRVAAQPTRGVLIVLAYIIATRWSKFADDPFGVAVVATLGVVVFLTYFILGLTGYTASPQGHVSVPRVYGWALVTAIVAVVFVVLFYVLLHRS